MSRPALPSWHWLFCREGWWKKPGEYSGRHMFRVSHRGLTGLVFKCEHCTSTCVMKNAN